MLTAQLQESPDHPPRVVLTSDRHPVYRELPSGTRQVVRGSLAGPRDQLEVVDYELPRGGVAAYTNGVETGDVVTTSAGPTWLVPLQEPEAAAPLRIRSPISVDKEGFGAWSYGETVRTTEIPGGAPVMTVLRSPYRSTTVTLHATSRDAWTRLIRAINSSPVHFVSLDEGMWPWQGVEFVTLTEVQPEPVGDSTEPSWKVQCKVTEVGRPAPPTTRPTGWAAMPDTFAEMPTTRAGLPE